MCVCNTPKYKKRSNLKSNSNSPARIYIRMFKAFFIYLNDKETFNILKMTIKVQI